jgi:serine/threonine protein kinase
MAERYEILEEVGKGAYGIVYRAKRKVRVVSPAPTGSGSLFHRAI